MFSIKTFAKHGTASPATHNGASTNRIASDERFTFDYLIYQRNVIFYMNID